MKEATGELSITVITVVAVAAVATLFYTLVWPGIQRTIVNNICATYGDYEAVKRTDNVEDKAGLSAAEQKYHCCSKEDKNDCID